MKRTTVIRLALVSTLGCIVLSGCAGGSVRDMGTPAAAPEDEEVVAEEETTAAATSSGSFWGDVPVYATAMQLQKTSWSIPPQDDSHYTQAEWHYYELPAAHSVQMVCAFYKMEMPKNGWQQMMEMDVEGVSMRFYTKNNENDVAYVWVASEDGKTVFALMRATK
ncbi:MAG: hypothetical protein JW846_05935 [Dehalococcoidia bacterium]|nr:hypothetical protein [Dehalococcoidia bacterium]